MNDSICVLIDCSSSVPYGDETALCGAKNSVPGSTLAPAVFHIASAGADVYRACLRAASFNRRACTTAGSKRGCEKKPRLKPRWMGLCSVPYKLSCSDPPARLFKCEARTFGTR